MTDEFNYFNSTKLFFVISYIFLIIPYDPIWSFFTSFFKNDQYDEYLLFLHLYIYIYITFIDLIRVYNWNVNYMDKIFQNNNLYCNDLI